MSKTCTGHLGLYCITKLQVRIFKSNCIFVLPSNRSDSVCIEYALPDIIFLDDNSGHQYRHKSAHTMVSAKTWQPISISGHNFYASRICSGATVHGRLQTRSRRSRIAFTWLLVTSVMNVNTSPRRRTRTPLNHVPLWRKGFHSRNMPSTIPTSSNCFIHYLHSYPDAV